jgi:hypothetical protein
MLMPSPAFRLLFALLIFTHAYAGVPPGMTEEEAAAIWAAAPKHYPLMDLGLKAPEAKDNVEADYVNGFLVQKTACRFYGFGSGSVIEGRVKPTDRIKVVTSAEELLSSCREIQANLGDKACSVVEIAGHADRTSIGLSLYVGNDRYPTVFGIDHSGGKRQLIPDDLALLKEIGSCFRDISADDSPIVFSTCGADRDKDGEWRFYPGKPTAQAELAKLFERPVISAIGPASSDGDATYSRHGWHRSFPKSFSGTRSAAPRALPGH